MGCLYTHTHSHSFFLTVENSATHVRFLAVQNQTVTYRGGTLKSNDEASKVFSNLHHQLKEKAPRPLCRDRIMSARPTAHHFPGHLQICFLHDADTICKPTAGSQRLPLNHRGYVPKSSGYLKLQTASGLKHHVFHTNGQGVHTHHGYTGQKHDFYPGKDGARFHHVTPNGM